MVGIPKDVIFFNTSPLTAPRTWQSRSIKCKVQSESFNQYTEEMISVAVSKLKIKIIIIIDNVLEKAK